MGVAQVAKWVPVTAEEDLGKAAVYIVAKRVISAIHYTNKTEHISFNSGCVVRVARCLNEDWFIVLR